MNIRYFTVEEARSIVNEEHEDWALVEGKMVHHHKQIGSFKDIFLHIPSGKHYSFEYDRGTGDWCEPAPYEWDSNPTAVEVNQVVVTTTEWVAKI